MRQVHDHRLLRCTPCTASRPSPSVVEVVVVTVGSRPKRVEPSGQLAEHCAETLRGDPVVREHAATKVLSRGSERALFAVLHRIIIMGVGRTRYDPYCRTAIHHGHLRAAVAHADAVIKQLPSSYPSTRSNTFGNSHVASILRLRQLLEILVPAGRPMTRLSA